MKGTIIEISGLRIEMNIFEFWWGFMLTHNPLVETIWFVLYFTVVQELSIAIFFYAYSFNFIFLILFSLQMCSSGYMLCSYFKFPVNILNYLFARIHNLLIVIFTLQTSFSFFRYPIFINNIESNETSKRGKHFI